MSRTTTGIREDPDEPKPPEPFHIRDRIEQGAQVLTQKEHQRKELRSDPTPLRTVFRIGGSVIRSRTRDLEATSGTTSADNSPTSTPTDSKNQVPNGESRLRTDGRQNDFPTRPRSADEGEPRPLTK